MTADARTRTLDQCLACGGQEIHPLAMRYEYMGLRFPAAECARCGMRFLRVQPTGQTLEAMYSVAYFEQDFRCGRSDASSADETAFAGENRGLVDRFEQLRVGAGRAKAGRLLEVGPAFGLLLKHAHDRGWQVKGVELSSEAAAHARSLGLDVVTGSIESAGLPESAFDIVYLGDVLEHVPDCLVTLAHVTRVLAPGGHLFLRGPITTNSLARRAGLALYGFAGRDIVLREPPYHLWEFTPRSLERLVRSAGLGEVRMEQAKIAPGRAHGSKGALQRAAMSAFDVFNLPLTRAFNAFGDRVVLTARKPER